MKIGIISDIHANQAALEAVLADLDSRDCVKILCCGDLVGYGPDPSACISIIRDRKIPCVRGNHDDLILNSERLPNLRREIRESVLWTRAQLSEEEQQWVGNLPFQREYAGLNIVHASHVFRPAWQYVMDRKTAEANFLFQKAGIAFHGHTHVPLISLHRPGTCPKIFRLTDLALPPHHKCLINAGAVGQPRDRNPDAAYVVFDSRTREVFLHRVAYDIQATTEKIRAAQLPERFSTRLGEGR